MIVMETRSGQSIGSRVMRIRVADTAAPGEDGIPGRKAMVRYLAMLIGFVPLLVGLVIYAAWGGPPEGPMPGDGLYQRVLELSSGTAYSEGTRNNWNPAVATYPLGLLGLLRDGDWLSEVANAAMLVWIVVLIAQAAMKRDPLYDRIAGTAVVRVSPGRNDANRA